MLQNTNEKDEQKEEYNNLTGDIRKSAIIQLTDEQYYQQIYHENYTDGWKAWENCIPFQQCPDYKLDIQITNWKLGWKSAKEYYEQQLQQEEYYQELYYEDLRRDELRKQEQKEYEDREYARMISKHKN